MQLPDKRLQNGRLEYYIYGDNPQILIDSGTHGDESEIIPMVGSCIEKYLDRLPNFLYVPKVSSTALALGTRKNKDGVDLNRNFMDQTQIQEAIDYMELVKPHHFQAVYSFHEDLSQKNFYMYDSFDLQGTRELQKFKDELLSLGVGLFTGIDDPDDPILRYQIEEGYHHYLTFRTDGTSTSWMAKNGIVERIMEPEIPGKVSKEKKAQMVDAVFRHFILQIT